MKVKLYSFIFAILLGITTNTRITEAKIFVLSLYFDPVKNEIVQDREATEVVAVSDESYELEENIETKEYYFKTNNFQNIDSDPFYFTPKSGKFALNVPYFEGTSEISIYNKDTLKLSLDVADFAACNINNACESSLGENTQNCIADCFAGEVEKVKNKSHIDLEPGTPLTGGNSNTNTPTSTTPTKTPILGLIVGLIMITGGIGYGVYRFIQRYRRDE